jgi:large subunit ribosomal protein L30
MSSGGEGVLKITLVRSPIGRPADQGRTVASLGLRRLHATVERPDSPSIRGMVEKIKHLVRVEEIPGKAKKRRSEGSSKDGNQTRGAGMFDSTGKEGHNATDTG